MAGPKITIAPPERRQRVGGIKSVVGDFTAAPRLAAAEALQWISDGCEFPKAAPGLCYVPNPVTGNKTFEGIEHGDGPIFALYQGVKCYLGTGDDPDYDERARALLEQGEARGVEEVLWEYIMTTGGTGPAQGTWLAAIGQMEELADTVYLGQPVIMMSRAAAVKARADKAIFGDEETGQLWTANGTPVIASAAAPDDAAAVMGWPTIYASDFIVTRTADLTVNQEMAIAERVYGIAIDCNYAHHFAVGEEVADPISICTYDDITLPSAVGPWTFHREGDLVTVSLAYNGGGAAPPSPFPYRPPSKVNFPFGSGSTLTINEDGTTGGGIGGQPVQTFTFSYLAVPEPGCSGPCEYAPVTLDLTGAKVTFRREGDLVYVLALGKGINSALTEGTPPWRPAYPPSGQIVAEDIVGAAKSSIIVSTTGLMMNTWVTGSQRIEFVYPTHPDPNCVGGTAAVQDSGGLTLTLGTIPGSPVGDSADITVLVQANEPPADEVVLWYVLNGGAPVEVGPMVQSTPQEFTWSVDDSITTPGDTFEVWALTTFDGNTVESNRITIEVV